MRLSRYFTKTELIKSNTAIREGIVNIPNEQELINLVHLCTHVLDPCRAFFGKPLHVTSGYRCLELNRLLKSKDNSQHTKGQAADIYVRGVDNMKLAEFIRDNLSFDQVIAEKLQRDDGAKGWVHASYNAFGVNRKNVLSYLGGGKYTAGLHYYKQ